jgi:hypothetical protein
MKQNTQSEMKWRAEAEQEGQIEQNRKGDAELTC